MGYRPPPPEAIQPFYTPAGLTLEVEKADTILPEVIALSGSEVNAYPLDLSRQTRILHPINQRRRQPDSARPAGLLNLAYVSGWHDAGDNQDADSRLVKFNTAFSSRNPTAINVRKM